MRARLLALAAAAPVFAGALAGCQAFWDLPGQMREPYGGTGAPPPVQSQDPVQSQQKEEKLP